MCPNCSKEYNLLTRSVEKPPSDTDTIVYNASDDPTAMAIAMLLDQGRNVPLWDDCRFIWDSASLLSSAAAESEVTEHSSASFAEGGSDFGLDVRLRG